MLKILAIQVLKECEEYIMRCLEPEVMYYLHKRSMEDGVLASGIDISMWYLKNSIAYVKTAK